MDKSLFYELNTWIQNSPNDNKVRYCKSWYDTGIKKWHFVHKVSKFHCSWFKNSDIENCIIRILLYTKNKKKLEIFSPFQKANSSHLHIRHDVFDGKLRRDVDYSKFVWSFASKRKFALVTLVWRCINW